MTSESDRLKILRKELHLKQGDFANKISTTQGHISDIENGRKNLSERTIKLICLENWEGKTVNEEWLRTGEGEIFEVLTGQEKVMKYAGQLLSDTDSVVAEAIKSFIVTYEQLDDDNKNMLNNTILKFIDNLKRGQ